MIEHRTAQTRHAVVVDGDPTARKEVDDLLSGDGFRVSALGDGETLIEMLPDVTPDIVILEMNLPGIQGLEVLQCLRNLGHIPVISVSADCSEEDRVVALEVGADDWLCKPFCPRELLARVHAVLRRSGADCALDCLDFNGLRLDLTRREVALEGRMIELTHLEFDLLAFMASSPRRVFSTEYLLENVWKSSSEWQTTKTVSEHIHRLRRKIEDDPSNPRWIQTLRGAGYRFVPGPCPVLDDWPEPVEPPS